MSHEGHDHDAEIAAYGLCLTCADAGMPDAGQPSPARQLVFEGETFGPEDAARLGQQMLDVLTFMADNRWHGLAEISSAIAHPEASVSARLRDLRKVRFGGHTIDRRRAGSNGASFEYRLAPA